MLNNIKRYISLIPDIIKNREQIVEGIISSLKEENGSLPEDESEEIIRRRVICSTCSEYKGEGKKAYCNACGCNINFKTACLSCICGADSYNMSHPDEKKEVKWMPYEKEKS